MHVILVTGSRYWKTHAQRRTIRMRLAEFPASASTFLIHGDCEGVDKIASAIGKESGFTVIAVPYIGTLGRSGGPVRNGSMIHLLNRCKEGGDETWVLAFHDKIEQSTGTAGCMKLAQRAGHTVELITGME